MEIPRYWISVDGISPHLGRGGGTITVWGWSDSSTADAERVGRSRLAETLARIEREGGLGPHRGYYPRVPLREPVLATVPAADGMILALITRNRMGCEVLNTESVLIADIDLAEPARPSRSPGGLGRFLRRTVLGRDEPDPTPTGDTPEQQALGSVIAFARANPSLGVRTYRTAAGLRVIVTGAGAPPGSPAARTILIRLNSDPLYVELCETHASFRARLTPKPFRIGQDSLPARWPWRDDAAGRRWQQWVTDYDTASRGRPVCRLLDATGPAPTGEELRLVTLHDQRTGVATPGALA